MFLKSKFDQRYKIKVIICFMSLNLCLNVTQTCRTKSHSYLKFKYLTLPDNFKNLKGCHYLIAFILFIMLLYGIKLRKLQSQWYSVFQFTWFVYAVLWMYVKLRIMGWKIQMLSFYYDHGEGNKKEEIELTINRFCKCSYL